jgi:hypothetical protein
LPYIFAGGVVGACSILGLFVPLYCLLAGFGLKEATALSQAAIAGECQRLRFFGSFVVFAYNKRYDVPL